ncbi:MULTISPECIES: DUF6392 family protein [Aeromonas]|uniref:DUF6392 family protein n=1 Tax=Aeromonas TaxID=642 RepID=UPI00107E716E|nr:MULTISPECIES: DUF6392 family protein [Aeromonas]MCV3291951.1 DUF6392 family protein [Aeromonas hydrophila]QBX71761.1 pyocin immunity protein [Aeromonas hydrophila]QBX76461.1 pyocin immunity protein [Aeromonas hydrophila]WDA26788.1 DUF6392 family protein [Aeromonas hydrophila]WES92661.1 DUF6392 family protein [Aeromonas hydrophila]
MTVNVQALINSLGMTYEAMMEAELIPYKTKPKGYSGDPEITLSMAKEGIFLSFDRSSRKLIEVDLELLKEEGKQYRFPNALPAPLWENMMKADVRSTFGEPTNSHPPYMIVNRKKGGTDHYIFETGSKRVSMLLSYNLDQRVTIVGFKSTEMVQWKELDPSFLL